MHSSKLKLIDILGMTRFRLLLTSAAFLCFAMVNYLFDAGLAVSKIASFVPWKCPSFALFSILCPSCGLTRSVLLSLSGDWALATTYHPLGPSIVTLCVMGLLFVWSPAVVHAAVNTKLSETRVNKRGAGELFVCVYAFWGFFIR